jgi:predicted secreted hydrolase
MKINSLFIACCLTLFIFSAYGENDWQRATAPRAWQFPRDHGAHREFKTEWWYYTGNLTNAEGRRFGYQFTIFRHGLQFNPAQKNSAWAIRDFYFAHFTVTDVQTGQFLVDERIERSTLNQAGASEQKMEAWIRDWRIETISDETYRLRASTEKAAIDFTVHPLKPLVLQGDRGLSQKAVGLGNASHYYSYPRLQTNGTLRIGSQTFTITGTSWFDHEFSTSSLGPEQVGWDWFSIQLDHGAELMLYGLRQKNGSLDVTSQGTWIGTDQRAIHISRADFTLEVLAHWRSPQTQALYPSRWKIKLPRLQVELVVEPLVSNQELSLEGLSKLAYWEGACRITGTQAGKPVQGYGYTELTGYATPLGQGMKE